MQSKMCCLYLSGKLSVEFTNTDIAQEAHYWAFTDSQSNYQCIINDCANMHVQTNLPALYIIILLM